MFCCVSSKSDDNSENTESSDIRRFEILASTINKILCLDQMKVYLKVLKTDLLRQRDQKITFIRTIFPIVRHPFIGK